MTAVISATWGQQKRQTSTAQRQWRENTWRMTARYSCVFETQTNSCCGSFLENRHEKVHATDVFEMFLFLFWKQGIPPPLSNYLDTIYIYMDVFVLSKNIINMYTVFCYKRFSFTWNGIRHPKWFLWMENWGYFGSSLNLGKQSNLHGYLLWFTLPCLCACHACNGATQHRWQRVVSKSHCMVVRVLQTKNKTVGTWVFHLYIYIYMYAKLANALCTVAFVTWPLIQPFAQESQIIVYEPSRMHAACCKYMALWKAWASGAGGHA